LSAIILVLNISDSSSIPIPKSRLHIVYYFLLIFILCWLHWIEFDISLLLSAYIFLIEASTTSFAELESVFSIFISFYRSICKLYILKNPFFYLNISYLLWKKFLIPYKKPVFLYFFSLKSNPERQSWVLNELKYDFLLNFTSFL